MIKSCITPELMGGGCCWSVHVKHWKVIKKCSHAPSHLHFRDNYVKYVAEKGFVNTKKTLSAAHQSVCLLLDQWGPALWMY